MARVSSLFALPESIRTELIKRRTELKHLTFDDHVEWLSGLGYEVSRSALGRYVAGQANLIQEAEAQQKEADQLEMAHAQSLMRLRCLEVASKFCDGNTKEVLLQTADELTGWVQATKTP
ncbi:DUF3486 family protein [Pseudomonas sp. FSL R10-0765]|uniref:phage protein Gp27 family protein n=1 Tax=Pseudomonas sp. FSL R10-0765 TaxID=2662195 RepID=UPI0012952FE0|nr:phage protein Gp27 family protein [Pseudomonas sp. FSL R10-0765]MQT45046.1 DUF3486 family protein [Pseudomonas sp. FSL R10-0765]